MSGRRAAAGGLDHRVATGLNKLLADAVGVDEPGVAVGVLRGGEYFWSAGRGLANLSARAPMTPQTPFRICSITKQFCCALVMREVALGNIELAAHPRAYVGWARALDPRLTIADLMQNRSGLRDQWVLAMMMGAKAEQRFTLDDGNTVMQRAAESMFAPNSQFLYCNGNFEILGQVLESISGRTFAELLAAHITSPLGMHHTGVGVDTAEGIPGAGKGYRYTGDGWVEEENAIHWAGSAGIVSTVDDLLKWANCLRDPAGRGLPWAERILWPAPFGDGATASYGYGISREQNKGRAMLRHAGALRGWRSMLLHYVREDTSIAVFMNRTNSPNGMLVGRIAEAVRDLLHIEPVHAIPLVPRRRLPKSIEGWYASPENGLLIRLHNANASKLGMHLHLGDTILGVRADTGSQLVFSAADGHAQVIPESESSLLLHLRDEHECARLRRVQEAPEAFSVRGRFVCTPLRASLMIETVDGENSAPSLAIRFNGEFGLGDSYVLHPLNAEFAYFDIRRGVDESPPGRVMLWHNAVDNSIELSCQLARRVVFRPQG